MAFCLSRIGVANAITIGNNDLGSNIGRFGYPDTLTYGQVFKSPISGTLDSFTLSLKGGVGALFGGVGTWNGTEAFGLGFGSPSNLFQSSPVASSSAASYTFNPGISVTAGQLYVAYLSVFGVSGANATTLMPLGNNSDPNILYFVWNNSSDPINNSSWNYFYDYGEVLFSATFSNNSNVPEPASMALVGLGLASFVALRRRKYN